MREQKPVSDSSFQTAGHGPSPGINLGNDIQHGEKENKGKENQSTKKEKKSDRYTDSPSEQPQEEQPQEEQQ